MRQIRCSVLGYYSRRLERSLQPLHSATLLGHRFLKALEPTMRHDDRWENSHHSYLTRHDCSGIPRLRSKKYLHEDCIIDAVDDNGSRVQYPQVLYEGHRGEIDHDLNMCRLIDGKMNTLTYQYQSTRKPKMTKMVMIYGSWINEWMDNETHTLFWFEKKPNSEAEHTTLSLTRLDGENKDERDNESDGQPD